MQKLLEKLSGLRRDLKPETKNMSLAKLQDSGRGMPQSSRLGTAIRKAALVAGFVLMGALISCGQESPRKKALGDVKTVAQVNTAWQQKEISVCWEIGTTETSSYRSKIRQTIQEKFAGFIINFKGFEVCDNAGADIRIFIYDDAGAKSSDRYKAIIAILESEAPSVRRLEGSQQPSPGLGHPRVRALGRGIKGLEAGLILNRTFENAQPGFNELYQAFSPAGRENIALSVAMHEFGHALGLRHEDAHSQRTCDDYAEDKGTGPDAAADITAYNPFSFMSRCYYRTFNYNLGTLMPNQRDIEGLNVLHSQLKK